MRPTVHPAFDGKVWFIDDPRAKAPSLRELQKIIGHKYHIEGYYPNGYLVPFFQRPAPTEGRTLVQSMAKKLPPSHKMPKPKVRGERQKHDHEAILNMWAKGHTGPYIGAALGMNNWKRVGMIVSAARAKGDPRAVSRTTNPKWRNGRRG